MRQVGPAGSVIRERTAGAPSFTLLGAVRGRLGARELELGSPQRRLVLAVLLLHEGGPVELDDLVDAVWGDRPPGHAVQGIRSHIANLRRVLEPERAARQPAGLLISVGRAYALRLPAGRVDAILAGTLVERARRSEHAGDKAAAREQLAAALELWQGSPLAGLPGPFAERHRERLAELRLAAQERRLALDLALGPAEPLLPEIAALSAEHPLREGLRGLHLTALHRAGRRAEALAVYARTRSELVAELGVEPGAELARLHRALLRDEPPPAPAEPPAPVIPAQLPADLVDFTGHAEVVTQLAARLRRPDPHGVPAVVISGMGGVGKSSLAIHVAHRIRDHFPDGQLYADLRGAGAAPAAADVLLGGFLRGLGVPEGELPAAVVDRAALLRSLLATRRVLVVLDDARDVDQVRPLLPGTTGTAVLITSRTALSELSGAHPLRLPVLPRDDALRLLAKIAGPERIEAQLAAAHRAVEGCGFLPLAVRIVGARLAARPGWSVARISDRLADQRSRLALLHVGELTVARAFQLGYDQLNSAQARAFRLLARIGIPEIPLPVCAAVLDCTLERAEEICEALVDLSLLDTPRPDRYRFHDLIRLFALEQPEPEGAAAVPRALDHYLATLSRLHRVFRSSAVRDCLLPTTASGSPIADNEAGQGWLDLERANLIALLRAAAAAGVVRVAADVAWALVSLSDLGTNPGETLRALEVVLHVAESLGDRPAQARLLAAAGGLQTVGLGQFLAAVPRLRRARTLAETEGNGRLRAWAEVYLTLIDWHLAPAAELADRVTAAVAAFDGTGVPWAEGILRVAAAQAYLAVGAHEPAGNQAEAALKLASRAGFGEIEAFAMQEAGAALSEAGEHDRALEFCTAALRLARCHGPRLQQGWALAPLARANLNAGHLEAAEAQAAEAVRILTGCADMFNRGRALVTHGRALAALHRTDEAAAVFLRACRFYARIRRRDMVDQLRTLLITDFGVPPETDFSGTLTRRQPSTNEY
ncbi:AfsR/SARP family transcriptional regulator [Nocardia asteroides]|uniref:AfsR/SARP family transcriptional regulator n=1 Tax=Nocardia asteroides TaxID=1824 RepID=UPI001E5A048A|nr:BTAD domain-containing putative transcriptional regulator [Nocardia asteroides]UGT63373.1 NB-ARC domain-containing protein [Nocardia asteroides]